MGNIAIRVESLSKRYRITAARHRHDTFRDQLTLGVRSLFSRTSRAGTEAGEVWALRDVSFDVAHGDAIGLIGRNGAGKSTLLKILSRITEPTSGRAEIHGRVGSLLEVGTGFDRELTGRENIFLSGAVLGMRKAEIVRKFDEIVAFAEVEKFVDVPVKRYSTGMYMRLAFAVAAHLEPEILLVDEVLAVGDAAFQKKCLGKMGDVTNAGRTVLFVSHNMAAMTRLCRWGLWLDGSHVRAVGPAEEVVATYLALNTPEHCETTYPDDSTGPGSEYVRLLSIGVRNQDGLMTSSLDMRTAFVIEVHYRILLRVSNLRIGIRITSQEGTIVFSTTDVDEGGGDEERQPGVYVSRCRIPGEFLNYGQYFVTVGADFPMIQTHFRRESELGFRIEQTGGVGGSIPDGRAGVLRVNLPWEICRLA